MEHPWDRPLGFWHLAEDQPGLTAIADTPDSAVLSYGELAGKAHQVVHALREHGLAAGDVIACLLRNSVDVVVWQLAAQESGLLYVSVNTALTGSEVRRILGHSGATVLVADARLLEQAGLAADPPDLRLRVVVGGTAPGFVPAGQVLDGRPTTTPDRRRTGGPLAYSSGTTGAPKAIRRPDLGPEDPVAAADAAKVFGRALQFVPFGGVHLVSAGMHHGGCQIYFHGALNVGQALAIMARFDAEGALRLIARLGVTTAYMVPTQFVRLLRLPEDVRARYDVSSLEVVVHSAAPCPIEVKRAMLEWWGPVIWETYGGMEGAATIAKPRRWLEKPGTVGRPVRGVSVKILDGDGRELPAGTTGDVYIETATRNFEYRDDPALTASVMRGKAFTLGDVGYLDDDGYLFLKDRASDTIISGGVNIYPAEVEAVLGEHPAVADVAVIGVPDDEWGERVHAIVEPEVGVAASDELASEVLSVARERLARYKVPRSVEFRASLNRTDGGKLSRRALRDEHAAAANERSRS